MEINERTNNRGGENLTSFLHLAPLAGDIQTTCITLTGGLQDETE